MGWVIIAGIAAWFIFGDPTRQVAEWLYPDSAAPWERVDAFYYPNAKDMSDHLLKEDVGGVNQCREWVSRTRGFRLHATVPDTYECAVGKPRDWMGFSVYRITVR